MDEKKLKEKKFREWCDNFEESPIGEDALVFFDDNAPYYNDVFKRYILKACFNAANFWDKSQEKRERDRIGIEKIEDEGWNQLKAIAKLRDFIKKHPHPANEAMAFALREVYVNYSLSLKLEVKKLNEEKEPTELILDKILAAYASGLEQYTLPQNAIYNFHAGCLLFPEPIKKQHLDPAFDGLVFELNYLIQGQSFTPPIRPIDPGKPLPPVKNRLKYKNELIAKLVNATLDRSINATDVKKCLDKLRKQKAKLVGWEFAE